MSICVTACCLAHRRPVFRQGWPLEQAGKWMHHNWHACGEEPDPLELEGRDLTAVSLFAGIGGFDLALMRAGVRVVAAVEIDPACRGILARHFPEAKLFNDVEEVTADDLRAAGFVPGRGIIAAGWPCQGNSVAGRRGGMGDPRSGLWRHVVRLLAEARPAWFLGENVPGLYSVNHGADIAVVRSDLARLGYWWAERILDAQNFGVPQRRNRIFFVGHPRDRTAPVRVLLEPEGGDWHLAAGGETGTRVAGTPAASAGSGGLGGIGQSASAITSRVVEATPLLEVGARTGVSADDPRCGIGIGQPGDPMYTLQAGKQHGVAVASTLQGGGKRGYRVDAEAAAGGHLITAGGACPAIANPVVASHANGHSHDPDTRTYVATAVDLYNHRESAPDGAAYPRAARDSDARLGVRTMQGVRRLTPRECERLQGFPDDWTLLTADGTQQADAPRYRQLGNALAVPVAEWIARRLVVADAVIEPEGDESA